MNTNESKSHRPNISINRRQFVQGVASAGALAAFGGNSGLLGALVIEPRDPYPVQFDREFVVLLSDWTDANPESIFSNLKQESDYYNHHRHTVANFISEAKNEGVGSTLRKRMAWARMNMSPNDIADVSGAAYTYLLNGNAPRANWTGAQPAGRTPSLHQWIFDDPLRCSYPWPPDDGSAGRR